MSGSKWKDQDIEELLKKMPSIKNKQSTAEMYTRIQRAAAGNKKTKRWIPIAAGLAAIFLLAILIPSFLMNNESMNISSSEDAGETENLQYSDTGTEESQIAESDRNKPEQNSSSDQARDIAEDEESGNTEEDPAHNITSQEQEAENDSKPQTEDSQPHSELSPASRKIALDGNQGTSLYPSELEGKAYFSTAFITPEQAIVPMTFILPEENTGQTMVDLYNEWAGAIDETSLGFIDYHPFKDKIEETEDIISGSVNHSDGSAALLAEFLRHTFGNDGYREFQLLHEDGSQAANEDIEGTIQLTNDRKGYFLYENGDSFYFVESPDSYKSVDEAVRMMQTTKPDERFSSALPSELDLTVVEDNTELTITSDGTISQYSDLEQQRIIEAILLTAKSFSFQTVQFENEPSATGGFDLSKPLEVPIGPNQASLE